MSISGFWALQLRLRGVMRLSLGVQAPGLPAEEAVLLQGRCFFL